jgi:hypothetical protein
MKRHLYAHLLLSAFVILPGSLAACKHSSSGAGSGGAQPPASASGGSPTADNDDTEDDDGGPEDETEGGGGGGGGKHGKHKKHANNADGGGGGGGGGKEEPVAKFVINKPTPEPLAAPALRHVPKIPTLPSFPERAKYPKANEPPKGGDAEGCGQVWSGNEWIPVECVDPDHHSKHNRAAKVVVPYDKMKQDKDKLPKMVDHHFDGTEGPVRKQGGPQCTAFAFTAGLDHAYARWTGHPGEFSVMQVWARYRRLEEKAATETNVGDFIANESDWPYDAKVANSWLKCGHAKKGAECGKAPEESKLKELDEKKKVAEITQVEVVGATQFEVMKEKIAGGQDLVIGLKLPNFETAGEEHAKYIVGGKGKAKEGHEVLLAGYAETPHGTYFLIHNSWGPKWGDEGYAWIHEDLIKEFWLDNRIAIPDVEPGEILAIRGHRHREVVGKCEKEKLPDSISGQCASKCPDGGPRHNNVCPDEKKNECPMGHVNLTGECVLSAPKASGSEGKVKWECARTGCTYEVPKGEFECKEKECQVSCPAPDFRLATTKKGLVCVE